MSVYFDSLRQANPELKDVTDGAFVQLMKRKQPQLKEFDDAAIIQLMDAKFTMKTRPIKGAPEEVEWYNKPIVDIPKFTGMKPPSELTDDDIERMRQVVSPSETSIFMNAPMNPQGPGSVANMQMIEAQRMASNDGMRMIYGGFYGAMEAASGLTTPTNLALLTAGGGLAKGTQLAFKAGKLLTASGLSLGQSAMSAVFAVQMGKELPEQYRGLKEAMEMAQDDPSLWGEIGRGLANIAVTGHFTLGAVKGTMHGIGQASRMKNLYEQKKLATQIETRKAEFEQRTDAGTELTSQATIDKEFKTEIDNYNKMVDDLASRKVKVEEVSEMLYQYSEIFDKLGEKGIIPTEIPYDAKTNLKYNPNTLKFDMVEAKMGKERYDQLKRIRKTALNKEGVGSIKEFHEMIRRVTGDNTRRLTKESLDLLQKRANLIEKDMTPTEVESLLATGKAPNPSMFSDVMDPALLNFNKYQQFKADWARSVYTTFDKMGRFGKVLNKQLLSYEHSYKVLRDGFVSKYNEVMKPLGKDIVRLKKFMEAWNLAEKTGEWDMRISKDKAIHEALRDQVLDPIRRMGEEFELEVMNPVTGKKIPFAEAAKNKRFYFPRKYDKRFASKFKANRDKMKTRLIEEYGKTEGEANQILNDVYDQYMGGMKEGSLEYMRIADTPGWLGDPRNGDFSLRQVNQGMGSYINGSIRKLMDLAHFEGKGGQDFVLRKEIDRITDPDLRQFVIDTTNEFRGIGRYGYDSSGISQKLRNIQVFRKLGLAQIQNTLQFALGTLPKYSRLGGFKTVKDAGKTIWEIGKDSFKNGLSLEKQASATGDAIAEAMDMVGKDWTSILAQKYLKATGFSKSEIFQRVFAEKMGRKYVFEMMQALNGKANSRLNEAMTDPIQRKIVMDELKQYGVSDKSLNDGRFKKVKLGDKYYVDELSRAAYLFARQTQFRSSVLDLPRKWQGSAAKVVLQFKSFTHNQARLVTNSIIKPFMKNPNMMNARPLMFWLGGAMASNAITVEARNLIYMMLQGKASKRDESRFREIMGDLATISPYAMAYEVYVNGLYGKSLFGPTAQDANDMAKYLSRGDFGKAALTTLPTPAAKAAKRLSK